MSFYPRYLPLSPSQPCPTPSALFHQLTSATRNDPYDLYRRYQSNVERTIAADRRAQNDRYKPNFGSSAVILAMKPSRLQKGRKLTKRVAPLNISVETEIKSRLEMRQMANIVNTNTKRRKERRNPAILVPYAALDTSAEMKTVNNSSLSAKTAPKPTNNMESRTRIPQQYLQRKMADDPRRMLRS